MLRVPCPSLVESLAVVSSELALWMQVLDANEAYRSRSKTFVSQERISSCVYIYIHDVNGCGSGWGHLIKGVVLFPLAKCSIHSEKHIRGARSAESQLDASYARAEQRVTCQVSTNTPPENQQSAAGIHLVLAQVRKLRVL